MTITMTEEQLDEYTRRVIAETLADRTAHRARNEREQRRRDREEQRRHAVEQVWISWENEIERMAHKAGDLAVQMILYDRGRTVPQIMAAARRLDAKLREEHATASPASPELDPDGVFARVFADMGPITYKSGETVRRIFAGRTEQAAHKSYHVLMVAVRRQLVAAAEGKSRTWDEPADS